MKRIVFTLVLPFFITLITIASIGTSAVEPKTRVKSENIVSVALHDNKATPEIVYIKVGKPIQFNSRDGRKHHLSQGTGSGVGLEHSHTSGIDSGEFGKDEAWRVVFKKVGIYSLHDHLNPKIFVTVIARK